MPITDRRRRVRRALLALFTDVVCVIVFCTIGRRSHAEGLTVAGIAQTAWPFLAGTGVGWLLIGGTLSHPWISRGAFDRSRLLALGARTGGFYCRSLARRFRERGFDGRLGHRWFARTRHGFARARPGF